MNTLHYRGDVRSALAGQSLMGPSTDGRYHRVEAAAYDPEADRTTAYLEEEVRAS